MTDDDYVEEGCKGGGMMSVGKGGMVSGRMIPHRYTLINDDTLHQG